MSPHIAFCHTDVDLLLLIWFVHALHSKNKHLGVGGEAYLNLLIGSLEFRVSRLARGVDQSVR